MSKLLYSAATSLDGFIAGPGGDMSWMTDYTGPNPATDALVESVGAILSGNRTFRGSDPHQGTEGKGQAYGGGWSGPQFVLTHHPAESDVPDVTFVSDLHSAVSAAREAAGGKYVNVLGADVARQCLEAGYLDEVLVCVMPVMIGDGVRLFAHPGGTRVRLERIGLSEAPTMTNIWFRVLK